MSDSSSDAVSAAYMPRIDHVRKARETNDYQQPEKIAKNTDLLRPARNEDW